MLHLNCFAIGYFATFLFSVSETSKRQKVVIVFVNQNAVQKQLLLHIKVKYKIALPRGHTNQDF